MWKGTKIMLALVLLLLCAYADAVAPGDEIERCRTGSFRISYPDGLKVLMDSRSYEQLLGVTGAVWDETDFDEHNIPSFSVQTNWKHSVGGVCRWSVQSCGYREGTQENWLFTQYILKDAPPNTNYNVSIGVEITYRISNCRPRNRCNPEIEVYNFITTSQQSREIYINRDFYNRIYYNRVSRPALVTENIYFNVTEGETGFYIAVRDPNSCILISKVLVTRFQCPAKQEDLVLYPETAAPVNNDMTVLTECVPNASPVTELEVTCDSTGNWAGVPTCKCDAGYKIIFDRQEGTHSCEACPAGFYRSERDPENVCKACPENTDLDVVAASECQCLTGYFRNTEGLTDVCPADQTFEGSMIKCTKPPSKPTSLKMTSAAEDSISVAWSSPDSLGERDDLYYTVEFSDPDNVGQMITANECMTSTSFTVTGMLSATDYVIRVTAQNGVSDQDADGAFSRIAEITVRTSNSLPGPPENIYGLKCAVVVWDEPSNPNGVITSYEIMFSLLDEDDGITISLDKADTFYIIEEFDMPGGAIPPDGVIIKVRAINDIGVGPWSDPPLLMICPTQDVPTCEVPEECPPTDCPDVTCPECQIPECPTPSACPPAAECPTCPSLTTTPITTEIRKPGTVRNVHIINCDTIMWDPPVDNGGEIMEYRIRIYTGSSYFRTSSSQRKVLSTDSTWVLPADSMPTQRPVFAMVKAKNSAGFAPRWSPPIMVSDGADCPCSV